MTLTKEQQAAMEWVKMEGHSSPIQGGQPCDICKHGHVLAALVRKLEAENTENDALFQLQHRRTVEADKLWKEFHNKPDMLPDLGELIGWLLAQRADMIKTLKFCAQWGGKSGRIPDPQPGSKYDHVKKCLARIRKLEAALAAKEKP